MCDPITASVAAAGAVKSTIPKVPMMPTAPPPIAPPEKQAEKLPDQLAKRAAKESAKRAGFGGPNSTWLTGKAGVPTSSLNLGSATLLGGT